MNYISEINGFNDWLETNALPKSAVALWYAIMHVNNKAKWAPSFEVAISTLEFKTKFKRSELFEARNILTQKGRMVWKPRGGNLCATYELIPFCVHNTDAIPDAKGYTNPDTKAYTKPTQKHTINKLNKDKTKLSIMSPPILQDVKNYFAEKNYSETSACKFYEYYETANWYDSKGNRVKNWKQKAQGVWFKDENKNIEMPASKVLMPQSENKW